MERAAISTKGFLPFAPLLISVSRQKDYSVDRDIIKASNHRISEWERLERSISGAICSNLPAQAVFPGANCTGIQVVLECLQGWRLHNLAGQPVPVQGHPYSKSEPSVPRKVLAGFNTLLFRKTALY